MERTIVRDATGQAVTVFKPAFLLWADVHEQKGGEKQEQSQRAATRSAAFKIRYTERVNETHAIRYRNRNYDITNVRQELESGRKSFIWIEAQSVGEVEQG